MKLSVFAKKESIGNPELFCGREQELKKWLDWVDLIPKEQAKSRALMATKKMGKTAILDRLFNILFERGLKKETGSYVIPFFLRIGEKELSEINFGQLFYLSFITQYLAFQCKKPEWVNSIFTLPQIKRIIQESELPLEAIEEDLEGFEWFFKQNSGNQVWDYVCSAPHRIASKTGEFILQILDEFQYLNKYIFVDELLSKQIDLAGSYHQWAESRIAPLLISGSWVGWLREILRLQLNPRFTMIELEPFSNEEALECVYNYGKLFQSNLSEESALAIQGLSRNHPYYISCLIRSTLDPDLSTVEGVKEVLQYEVNHKRGEINGHWKEYIDYAFQATNGRYAKAIVILLSKERKEEKTRPEIQAYLTQKGLPIDDEELEKKLKLLARSDVIEEGSTAFRFQGIPDDLFNQVFQVLYAEEIENLKREEILAEIKKENQILLNSVDAKIFQQNKGYFLEFVVIRFLKYQTVKKSCPPLQKLIQNAPENAQFYPYQTVGERHYNLSDGYHRQFDVIAKTLKEEDSSLLVECKYHEKPIGSSDIDVFAQKVEDLRKEISCLVPILYSVSSFTQPAKEKMKQLQISWSTPEFWDVLGLSP